MQISLACEVFANLIHKASHSHPSEPSSTHVSFVHVRSSLAISSQLSPHPKPHAHSLQSTVFEAYACFTAAQVTLYTAIPYLLLCFPY